MGRQRRRFLLGLTAGLLVGAAPAIAQSRLSQAVGQLGEERSHAESGVAFLKRDVTDQAKLGEGQRLYTDAKAAFDGLIETLLAELAQGRDPHVGPGFQTKAKRAVEKRRVFSRYVEANLLKRDGTRGLIGNWLGKASADIIRAVVDGAVLIWKTWREGDAEERRQIATRLEAQRWKPFADIAAAP